MKKIALEEHLGTQKLMAMRGKMLSENDVPVGPAAEAIRQLLFRCCDVEQERIPDMDQNEIAVQVLQNASNGIHSIQDEQEAIALEKEFNNYLSEIVAAHPDRFLAFAELPLISPKAAAEELERCIKDLGFLGAVIPGRLLSNGKFIDEPEFDCIWETADKLKVPLYIHPTETFPDATASYKDHKALIGATFSWGVDTAAYVSRIIFSGVFDRYPQLNLIVGHMGEMLPYNLRRMDSHWNIARLDSKNRMPPSAYFRENIFITTSGCFSQAALKCAMEEMGDDRIFFGVDYPFEQNGEAVSFIESADIPEISREKICYENAAGYFRTLNL